MDGFVLTVSTVTPVILNRWLTLDAILDGVMEAGGVPAAERVLPLCSWDGSSVLPPMTAEAARAAGSVFLASAAIVGDSLVEVTPRLSDDRIGRAAVPQPAVSTVSFKGGINPVRQFTDGDFPFEGRARQFRTASGPTSGVLRTYRTIQPGVFEWLFTGDPDGVLAIMSDAIGIGAKVRSGFGEIAPDGCAVEAVAGAPALMGVFDEGGRRLMRPIPRDLSVPSGANDARLKVETVRPPYWDRSGEVAALVPDTTYDSLLTRTSLGDIS